MFGLLKSLFLDEKARKALDKRAAAAKAPPVSERQRAIAKAQAQAKGVMTPERAELLRNAMAVHKAKRRILDDLSDEDRAKLVALAITSLMNEGREPDKGR
ncbi:MAG: hypothetical protein ACM33T_09580 [Solirubrobacterales bacterium]